MLPSSASWDCAKGGCAEIGADEANINVKLTTMLTISSSFDFMASLQFSHHPIRRRLPALISIKLRQAGKQIGATSSSNRHLGQSPLDGHQIA
jgi:hypothetical protein